MKAIVNVPVCAMYSQPTRESTVVDEVLYGMVVEILDEVIPVTDPAAKETARSYAATQGVLVGISSGAALWAALELAKRPENAGKVIVTLLPDSGERYLSTDLYK